MQLTGLLELLWVKQKTTYFFLSFKEYLCHAINLLADNCIVNLLAEIQMTYGEPHTLCITIQLCPFLLSLYYVT